MLSVPVLILITLGIGEIFSNSNPLGGTYVCYVDLNSGKVLVKRFVLGLLVQKWICRTPFSELVQKMGIRTGRAPQWRFLETREEGFLGWYKSTAHSPHIGRAFNDCNNLPKIFRTYDIPEEEKRKLVLEFLCLLKAADYKRTYNIIQQIIEQYPAK